MKVKGILLFSDVHLRGGKKREIFRGFRPSRGNMEFVDAITLYRFGKENDGDIVVGRIEVKKGKICVIGFVPSKKKKSQ